MKNFLKTFSHCVIRNYKGGNEIRTKNLEHDIEKARNLIKKEYPNIEIFEKDIVLNSFSVRVK